MTIDQKLDLILDKVNHIESTLKEHSTILREHSDKLDMHSNTLKEHGAILGALKHGQEEMKADLDGFKIETYKQLGKVKAKQENLETNFELLAQKTWSNEKDLFRIKKLIGIE